MSRHPLLDDLGRLSDLDPHGVGQLLAGFPPQCRQALTLTASPPLAPLALRHIVVAGMGGSAVAGDLVRTLALDRLPVPITVWQESRVPTFVGPDSLVAAVSYSGDTEEAVSALRTALHRGAPAAVLTSGGQLAELAGQRGLPLVRIPSGLMPRLALGYLFFPLLRLLQSAGYPFAGESELREALRVLEAMGNELRPECPERDNEAKRLALTLAGRIPVIYGNALTEVVAYRWKTDVEENAKLLAFHGRLPEADHNEIEGWGDPRAAGFHAMFLRDLGDDEGGVSRVRVTGQLIRAHAGGARKRGPEDRGRSPASSR